MSDVTEKFVGVDGSYKQVTVDAIGVPQYSSNLIQLAYEYGFGEREDLLSKIKLGSRILVLGSGDGSLVADFRRERRDCEIIDLNPAFANKNFPGRDERKQKSVAAFNPELPFPDGSFDLIVDEMSSIYYAKGEIPESTRRIEEIDRVLKNRGMALIGPILPEDQAIKISDSAKEVGIKLRKIDMPYLDGKVKMPRFVLEK